MLVTILVAIYKSSNFIDTKLKNLLRQTIIDQCDVIILNCQNLENEHEIYKHYLRNNVTDIIFDNYIKLYKSWNIGILQSTSKYIVNSNVDDMWHPQYLEKCVNALEQSEYCCMSSEVAVSNVPNQIDHTKWHWYSTMPFLPYPESSAGPCPVWRRSLHEKYGYFQDYYVIGDAKLWEKWYANGEKFGLIDGKLVLYYTSSDSLERRYDSDSGKLLRDVDIEKTNQNKKDTDSDESTAETTAQNHSECSDL